MQRNRIYLLSGLATVFFGGAYAYVFYVGQHLSAQPPSVWILGANGAAVLVSLGLLLYLQHLNTQPDSRYLQLVAVVLLLYNFGLLMQYSNGQNIAPKMDDLAVLRPSDRGIADSLYRAVVAEDFPALAEVTEAQARRRASQGDSLARAALLRWSSKVNQALEQKHAEERTAYILAQIYQQKVAEDPAASAKAAHLLSQREANPFDALPLSRKLGGLAGRFLPILLLAGCFACFGKGLPKHFRYTGLMLVVALLSVTVWTLASHGWRPTLVSLGLVALAGLFAAALIGGERLGDAAWYHLFEGWWRRVGTVTLYLSFAGAIAAGLLFALGVWQAGIGAAEVLKLPMAFILMWVLYLLYVRASISHDLHLRGRLPLRESPLFYPTSLLALLLMLGSPLALTVALDVGQAAVLSFSIILLLLGTRHDIRGAQWIAFLLMGVVVVLYQYLVDPAAWQAVMRVLNRDVFWIVSLLVVVGILVFWATPYYRTRRLAVANEAATLSGITYTPWTRMTHFAFSIALALCVTFLVLRVAATRIVSHATVQHRLALFDDVFSYRLVGTGSQRMQSWWDAAHNLVESVFGMLDAGWFGASLGRGGAEYVTKVSQDFMFSAIVSDWGLVGGLCILGLVVFLIGTTYLMTASLPSVKQRFFARTVASFFAAQTLVTVLGSMGGLPITGVPFPLVSDGLTSATTYALLLGLVAVMQQRQGFSPTILDVPTAEKRRPQRHAVPGPRARAARAKVGQPILPSNRGRSI